jgi:hypothetical protein
MRINNLILAPHTQSVNGLEELFYDSGKKFLQPTLSGFDTTSDNPIINLPGGM